ncbi:MAG: GNAT family N-acetyltransferase [Erythrobacter sp.]|nr:GNAT family N-acetyltransferase [Erythrobacter sp.]
MFHRSERLLLRPVWPEDWESVFSGIADEGVVRNLASAPWPYREEDARAFTQRPVDPLRPRFIIARADNAALVGCIGIDTPPQAERVPARFVELGYWIARAHWGRGYASEAGRAVISLARTLGHRGLVGSHFLDNPASGRVLKKLGFAPTGRVIERHSCARGALTASVQHVLSFTGRELREGTHGTGGEGQFAA